MSSQTSGISDSEEEQLDLAVLESLREIIEKEEQLEEKSNENNNNNNRKLPLWMTDEEKYKKVSSIIGKF